MREFDPTKDSDGASGFISFFYWVFTGRKLPWEAHAVIHDSEYFAGGPLILRRLADATLERHVYYHYQHQGLRGFKKFFFTFIVPRCIYYGVRIGGQWFIPFPSLTPVKEGGTFTLRDRKWKLGWNQVRWGFQFPYPRYK